MADPQKPEPNVFWCPKCKCHGDFVVRTEVHNSPDSSSTSEHKHCKKCDTKGGQPRELKEDTIWAINFFGFGILALFILILIVCAFMFPLSFLIEISYIFLGAYIFLLPLFLAPYLRHIRDYFKWKKWAKERGWEGE